ncbi:uncharacterized protein BDZ99DRAFT_514124 [Mytilinidion resinicola]|uniref:Uncharacterized protein n=1 Tax=Mytilinidion resinicola TaxID=574789 RepID=A0A6A6ZB21_9PEZI|nr:uncharacterized protein BDZ99DRAFT_514124 [Mytilinidion resinicola]KAF2817903.1 hypothetical protein BDZ99DRAFT_514124 [Mytilinidion resinicola]
MASFANLHPPPHHPSGSECSTTNHAVDQGADEDSSFAVATWSYLTATVLAIWARIASVATFLILAVTGRKSKPAAITIKRLPTETLTSICEFYLQGAGPIFVESGTWRAQNDLPGVADMVKGLAFIKEIMEGAVRQKVPHIFDDMSVLYSYYTDHSSDLTKCARRIEVKQFDNPHGPRWDIIWAKIEDVSPLALTVGAPGHDALKPGIYGWLNTAKAQRDLFCATAPTSLLNAKRSDEYRLKYMSNIHGSVFAWWSKPDPPPISSERLTNWEVYAEGVAASLDRVFETEHHSDKTISTKRNCFAEAQPSPLSSSTNTDEPVSSSSARCLNASAAENNAHAEPGLASNSSPGTNLIVKPKVRIPPVNARNLLPNELWRMVGAELLHGASPVTVEFGTWEVTGLPPAVEAMLKVSKGTKGAIHYKGEVAELHRHVWVTDFANPDGTPWETIWSKVEEASPLSLTIGAPSRATFLSFEGDLFMGRAMYQRDRLLATVPLSILRRRKMECASCDTTAT